MTIIEEPSCCLLKFLLFGVPTVFPVTDFPGDRIHCVIILVRGSTVWWSYTMRLSRHSMRLSAYSDIPVTLFIHPEVPNMLLAQTFQPRLYFGMLGHSYRVLVYLRCSEPSSPSFFVARCRSTEYEFGC